MKILSLLSFMVLIAVSLAGCTVDEKLKTSTLGDEKSSVKIYRFCGIPYFEERQKTTTKLPN